ncbi:unnamed protein product [Cochlearia groenlandica]
MEASSSSKPSDSSDQSASKLLSDLPCRGFMSSSTFVSSNPGSLRVYICEHDTSPPEGQHIKTNQQNILIRSLLLKKQKGESSSKDTKGTGEDGPRKRAANKALDDRSLAKRAAISSKQGYDLSDTMFQDSDNSFVLKTMLFFCTEGSSSRTGERDFQSLTVEKLRALLKEKGLQTKGRKDELIARLKNAN